MASSPLRAVLPASPHPATAPCQLPPRSQAAQPPLPPSLGSEEAARQQQGFFFYYSFSPPQPRCQQLCSPPGSALPPLGSPRRRREARRSRRSSPSWQGPFPSSSPAARAGAALFFSSPFPRGRLGLGARWGWQHSGVEAGSRAPFCQRTHNHHLSLQSDLEEVFS